MSCAELRRHFEIEDAARFQAQGYERAIATDVAERYLKAARELNCRWAYQREMQPIEPEAPEGGAHEAAVAFTDSIRGVHQAIRAGDCQDAADRFSDAGDWYADVVRFAEQGAYNETLLAVWEERYKGAYEDLEAACDVQNLELNGCKKNR